MAWVIGIGVGLFLLFVFPRQMGALILFLLLAAAGIGGWLYLHDQKLAEERRQKEEKITLSAAYDINRCSIEFPILITIRNGYTETIKNMTFELGGYRHGYSSPIYREPFYKSDRIIAPGETYTACWTKPPLDYGAQEISPEGLTWRASYSYASFEEKP